MAVNAQINANTQYDYSQDARINDLTDNINEKLTDIQVSQARLEQKIDMLTP